MSGVMVRKVTSFAAVGAGVFGLVQLTLFVLVDVFFWNPSLANIVVLSGSVWVNYRLSQRFTWNQATFTAQGKRFVIARLTTMLLSFMIFNALIGVGMYYLFANAIGVAVGMVVNFFAAEHWVFQSSRSAPETPVRAAQELNQKTVAVAAVVLTLTGLLLRFGAPKLFVPMLLVIMSLIAASVASLFLISLLYAHRHHTSHYSLKLPPPRGEFRQKFAVLMPARNELTLLPYTIINAAWTQRDHPSHRFFPVICDDDPDTIRVAIAAALVINRWQSRMQTVSSGELEQELQTKLSRVKFDGSPLSRSELKNLYRWRATNALVQILVFPLRGRNTSKPMQMNYAFRLLKGSGFTAYTILDAESYAQEGLFAHVDQAFQDNPEVSIIQGAVQLMNPIFRGSRRSKTRQTLKRWYAWHSLLEYYRWFSGQMSFQSDNNFAPLGGNTVFVKTDLLLKTGGWPETLTEDCALGVKSCALYDARLLTFYDPLLATQEETTPSVRDLLKQRTRWTQGFLQSFLAGEWRALPTRRQRLLALWVLSSPFFQAVSALQLPFTIAVMVFDVIKSPPSLVLVMFVPLLAMVLVTVLQLKQLHEYGKSYGRKVAWFVYLQVVVTQWPYQWLLSYAALRAVVRHYNGKIDWQSPARAGDLLINPVVLPELV